MSFHTQAKKYLEEIGIQALSFPEIDRRLRQLSSDAKIEGIIAVTSLCISGHLPSDMRYKVWAEHIGDKAIHDWYIGTHLDGIEWQLEETAKVAKGSSTIVDAGCGTGIFACFLAQQFPDAHVEGFDCVSAMVERAEERKEKLGLKNIRFYTDDFDDPSKHEKRYDLVVCANAFSEGDCEGQLSGRRFSNLQRLCNSRGGLVISGVEPMPSEDEVTNPPCANGYVCMYRRKILQTREGTAICFSLQHYFR